MNAVLFDLDNTLISEDDATFAAVRAAGAAVGLRGQAFVDAVASNADRLWRGSSVVALAEQFGIWWGEALWGGFTGDDAPSRAMREFVPGFRASLWRAVLADAEADPRLVEPLTHAYIEARRSGETIYPDAEPVLADLARDHALALVTNGAGDVQREKLARTPLEHYFKVVLISAEVGIGKPAPGIFLRAVEALGARTADTTMVGDSLARDVAGARAAGLRTIWIDRKLWKEKPAKPDVRIERLSDLRARLDELERQPASPRATT